MTTSTSTVAAATTGHSHRGALPAPGPPGVTGDWLVDIEPTTFSSPRLSPPRRLIPLHQDDAQGGTPVDVRLP
jgi:hypothetical protein